MLPRPGHPVMVEGMTTTEGNPTAADVDAAVERWAAAAGVPASVAQGHEDRTPAARRLLRGVALGLLAGLPLVFLAQFDGPAVLLVLAGLLLVLAVARQHRASVR